MKKVLKIFERDSQTYGNGILEKVVAKVMKFEELKKERTLSICPFRNLHFS